MAAKKEGSEVLWVRQDHPFLCPGRQRRFPKAVNKVKVLVAEFCPTLCQPTRLPLSMGFSGPEYWGGLPFPSPGHLLNPGIEPRSSTFAGRFFTNWATREAPFNGQKSSVKETQGIMDSMMYNVKQGLKKWFVDRFWCSHFIAPCASLSYHLVQLELSRFDYFF